MRARSVQYSRESRHFIELLEPGTALCALAGQERGRVDFLPPKPELLHTARHGLLRRRRLEDKDPDSVVSARWYA